MHTPALIRNKPHCEGRRKNARTMWYIADIVVLARNSLRQLAP